METKKKRLSEADNLLIKIKKLNKEAERIMYLQEIKNKWDTLKQLKFYLKHI